MSAALGALTALAGQIRLLVDCGESAPAGEVLDAMAAERAALDSRLATGPGDRRDRDARALATAMVSRSW